MARWSLDFGHIPLPLCLLVIVLGSCGPSTSPESTPAEVGHLLIRANVGPISPVTVVGTPEPTASPEVCTSRGLQIYRGNGTTLVERFHFRVDCTYERALSPGTYVIKMPPNTVEISKDLPKTVEVRAGETTEVSVEIDTGIR